jgi:subtilase family serine protease
MPQGVSTASPGAVHVPSRILQAVDESKLTVLRGNIHPLARPEFDAGALPDSRPMRHMLLLLQRSQEQELALTQLMDSQQTKGSGSYHAWLTPEQFGEQFGPSDADVQKVTGWLAREGFTIDKVAAGRTVVEFSGNVAQVRNAFHTEIHRYVVNGEERFANVSDPTIPTALAPVVAGVVALHNFPKHAQLRPVGTFQRDLATGQVRPLFTYTDLNGTFYGVGPADFAKIYNVPASISGNPAGQGQTIAIVGQSNINIQDVRDFRSMFGLPANDPQIIINGPDPGLVAGDEGESDLDVEWAGAVAPAAQIVLVTTQSTDTDPTQVIGGVDLSALYIIDNDVAPVMSESYGACEAFLGSTGNAFYNDLWRQAAAEGITVVVAAGDSGSAACDPSTDPYAATMGLAVSGVASTPYNVAMGGTDFDQFTDPLQYWSPTNNSTTQLSALGYIAETTWDDSTCAANYLANPTAAPCSSVDQKNYDDISAGGGGASNCATSTTIGNTVTCTAGYPKPAFQSALTPADSTRDIPDIALFASNGFNLSFYITCQSDANPNNARCDLATSPTSGTHNFSGAGGTSGGTPTFAAIVALVNQQTGQRQGNVNYPLYVLAANENYANCISSSFTNPANPAPATCVFYDITKGTNTVACDAGSLNCSNQGTGFGVLLSGVAVDNGNPAYRAGTGYDLATGLGSINVANLLANWSSAARAPTTTMLGVPSPASGVSGQTTFSVPVSVAPQSGSGTPTGDVSLVALASDQKTILGSFGPFALSGGAVTAETNLLPPGTEYTEAYYGGSAAYGASTSMPAALAVSGAGLTSKTTLSFVTFDANGNPILSTSSQNVPYGSSYILQVAVTPSNGTPCTNASGSTLTTPGTPCPTGKVSLTDNGAALDDWPIGEQLNATNSANLNGQGIAEDQSIQLAPGSHNLQATFTSGDTNYQSSPSNTLSVTITKAATTTLLVASPSSITAGASVTLTAYVATLSDGSGPTGSVHFSNGSTSLGSATCAPTSGAANSTPPISQITVGTAYCVATLTANISGLYPAPDSGPGMPVFLLVVALVSAALFGLGWRWMPAGRRRAYACAALIALALLAAGITGCGSSGGGGGGGGSNRTITATYPGDTNYTLSSGSASITVH